MVTVWGGSLWFWAIRASWPPPHRRQRTCCHRAPSGCRPSTKSTRTKVWGPLEMRSQVAEPLQDEEASVGRDDLLLFQPPGVLVGNQHGVEPRLERWIDIGT